MHLDVELTSIDSDIDDKDILRKQLGGQRNDWRDHYSHLTSLASADEVQTDHCGVSRRFGVPQV